MLSKILLLVCQEDAPVLAHDFTVSDLNNDQSDNEIRLALIGRGAMRRVCREWLELMPSSGRFLLVLDLADRKACERFDTRLEAVKRVVELRDNTNEKWGHVEILGARSDELAVLHGHRYQTCSFYLQDSLVRCAKVVVQAQWLENRNAFYPRVGGQRLYVLQMGHMAGDERYDWPTYPPY